jgi:hypothetical protein
VVFTNIFDSYSKFCAIGEYRQQIRVMLISGV